MNILINASNLSFAGGAGQVADSICKELCNYQRHYFIVVIPKSFEKTINIIKQYSNVKVITYKFPKKDWISLLTSRNKFLDSLVEKYNIQSVLTIFGPTKWVPKCQKHLCGFAYPHIPLSESEYFKNLPLLRKIKAKFSIAYMTFLFKRCASFFYTENPLITELVKKKFNNDKIYTITNNYNQIFEKTEEWNNYELPPFNGVRILSASSMMDHKNLKIALEVARVLKRRYPDFLFQFILTVNKADYPEIPKELENNFYFTGPLYINKIPSLYKQSNIIFQPSLLECFSATYPEAMIMNRPLIVPNLEFARGLCKKAAIYYEPTSAVNCAEKLYEVANDQKLRSRLINHGRKQLMEYDSYKERVYKLINICEKL